jgi:hypothetical protein
VPTDAFKVRVEVVPERIRPKEVVVPLRVTVLVPTVEPITVACVPDELPHTFRFTAEVPD